MSSFDKMKPAEEKLMADMIFWILNRDSIKLCEFSDAFNIQPAMAAEALEAFSTLNIVAKLDPDDPNIPVRVIPTMADELPMDVVLLLVRHGHTSEDIRKAFGELPREEKTATSNILTDGYRKWNDINVNPPKEGVPLVIRFMNKSMVYAETTKEIVYAEDLKIASWDGEKWTIMEPHPRYDYSPLSNKDKLNEGSEVTHWSEPSEEDLTGWKSRFDPIGTYKYLRLEVDKENEEDVYRALIWGASFLARAAAQYPKDSPDFQKVDKMHQILCDLQCCIDRQSPIVLSADVENTATESE